ncbi:MAG: hypothetical protein ACTHN3_12220 [Solirubrobacterales bacterium]
MGESYALVAGRLPRPASATWRQLTAGSRPVWITSVALALLTWPTVIGYPSTGLDPSWRSGLYMAVAEGKHFGTEAVFTYGPLGFLSWPELWVSWLAALAFLYFCLIYVAFTAVLTWSLNRTVGLLGAAVIVFLSYSAVGFLEELPLLIAVGLSFAAMRDDRPDAAVKVLVVTAGVLCAIEPLIKLSVGPPTALVALLGLAGARASRRQWAAFAAIAIGGFFAAWFLCGQGLGNLWDYAVNGAQVISGYNEAMGFDAAETWEAVMIVVSTLGLIAFIHRAGFRDRWARWFATALTAVAAYVVFKYGTTQFSKGGPPMVSLTTLLAIFMLAPWPRRRAGAFIATIVVFGLITLHAYPNQASLDALTKLETFKKSAELAIRPGLRQGTLNAERSTLQTELNVPQQVLAAVGDKPVAIDPWEISVAWAYELNWRPLPVFQNYTAYTSKLDRLNTATVEDPNGPQVLLRQMQFGAVPLGGRAPFFGRQPIWDPPEQNLAAVCDFIPTLTEGNWQVLSRIPNRCEPPNLIATESAEPGEYVPVPRAGRNELVVLDLKGAEVEGLERAFSLFWRPDERRAVIDHGQYTYRLIPGTSGDGLIVSADRSLDRNVNLLELPVIRNISIEGADGSLQFDFYRIKLKPIRLVPKKQNAAATKSL